MTLVDILRLLLLLSLTRPPTINNFVFNTLIAGDKQGLCTLAIEYHKHLLTLKSQQSIVSLILS
jgi:hypothetical protein